VEIKNMNNLLTWLIPLPLKERRFFDYKILSSWYFLGFASGIILAFCTILGMARVGLGESILAILIILPAVSIIYGYISYWVLKRLRVWKPSKYPGYVWWILPIMGPFTIIIGIFLILTFFSDKEDNKRISYKQVQDITKELTVKDFKKSYRDPLQNLIKKGKITQEEVAVFKELEDLCDSGFSKEEASLDSLFDDISQEMRDKKRHLIVMLIIKLLEGKGFEIYDVRY
jgi:phosphate/sulfate permease